MASASGGGGTSGSSIFGFGDIRHRRGSGDSVRVIHAEMRRHPLGDGGEFHALEEGNQLFGIRFMHREFRRLFLQWHLVIQGHQPKRDAGVFGILDQGFRGACSV